MFNFVRSWGILFRKWIAHPPPICRVTEIAPDVTDGLRVGGGMPKTDVRLRERRWNDAEKRDL